MTTTRTICIPVDESKDSVRSIRFYLEQIANPKTDKVILIHVRVPEAPSNDALYPYTFGPFAGIGFPPMVSMTAPKSNVPVDSKARSLLHGLAQQLGPDFDIKGIILAGQDVKQCLVKKINELDPSLVLIGHRGLGPFSRIILGSVSRYLVNHSKCPVTLVPPAEC